MLLTTMSSSFLPAVVTKLSFNQSSFLSDGNPNKGLVAITPAIYIAGFKSVNAKTTSPPIEWPYKNNGNEGFTY